MGKERLESERALGGRLQDKLAHWDGSADWYRDMLFLIRATALGKPFSRIGGKLCYLNMLI